MAWTRKAWPEDRSCLRPHLEVERALAWGKVRQAVQGKEAMAQADPEPAAVAVQEGRVADLEEGAAVAEQEEGAQAARQKM